MRRIVGWLLIVLGVLVCVPSLAAAVSVGADDTAQTGPHDLTTAGVAMVTEAEALRYVGPVLHLTVERVDGGPVFVGVAHEVDAQSYVGEHSRRVVSRVGLPWNVESGEREGSAEPVPAPADQPWWLVDVEGSGAQELVWPLTHGRYSIVALASDGSPELDLRVTLGLEIDGTFYTVLAVAAFGLLLALLGLWLLLRRRRAEVPSPGAPGPVPAPGPMPASAGVAGSEAGPWDPADAATVVLPGPPTEPGVTPAVPR